MTRGEHFQRSRYQNENDAQRAIAVGRGMLINGRPCRTEVAKVNRKLVSLALDHSVLV